MTYGDREHFERWAADKHGRAKTPEFYVRSHEPSLSRAEAEQKAAALREQWGLPKLGGAPKARKASAPKPVRASAPKRTAAPPRPTAPPSPAERALAAYAEALRRKALADERVRELQAALNAALVERDACDHDIRETWTALEALNAQVTTAGASSVLAPPNGSAPRSAEVEADEGPSEQAHGNGNGGRRQGRRKSS